jgi:endonuclease III
MQMTNMEKQFEKLTNRLEDREKEITQLIEKVGELERKNKKIRSNE